MKQLRNIALLAAIAFYLLFGALAVALSSVAIDDVGGTAAGALGVVFAELGVVYVALAMMLAYKLRGEVRWLTAERLLVLMSAGAMSTAPVAAVAFALTPVGAALYVLLVGAMPALLYMRMRGLPADLGDRS